MSMDGLTLRAMTFELAELVGGKIDKVQQPDRDALLLTVRNGGKTHRLLLSAHAENGRVQLTALPYANPAEPPTFCMLLRRRLVGGRIDKIEQSGMDRVLTLRISARDELYDTVEHRLVVELMGKYSNITFVQQDGLIGDCIKHVGPAMSSVRTLLPGLPFTDAPAQDKINLAAAEPAEAARLFQDVPNLAKALCDRCQGLSRASVGAFLSENETAATAIPRLLAVIRGELCPTLLSDPFGDPVAVYPFLPALPSALCERTETLSEALDRFYARRDMLVRIQRHSAALRRVLETHVSRTGNKLAAFDDAIRGESHYAEYRLFGELLTANMGRIPRGADSVTLENYYETPPVPVAVPLDAALSPGDNAQRYFKKYRKSKLARAYALEQRGALSQELDYLEGQLDNIAKCTKLAELLEIRDELIREKYLRPERKGVKLAAPEASRPMRFRSSDGIELSVGKNNRQNDALTLKADGEQYWLHVKNIPGSHVIVSCKGEPPRRTLLEAAQLAAYFSRARVSASVPVDYTPRKYVKKPAGARPGMVIYTTNRTLFVTPDESLVKALTRID